MKKKYIIVIISCVLITTLYLTYSGIKESQIKSKYISNSNNTINSSKDKLYDDIIVSLLFSNTQEAVDAYYSKYLKISPHADPNFDTLISTERMGDQTRHDFLIKIETLPYFGPHNSVGRDNITFRVNASGDISLEKFEHLESSQILPQLYPDIIKYWPPK